jgi:hypothetical protein
MRLILVLFLLTVVFVLNLAGQDTLPRFSALTAANGKTIISWRNNYRVVNQISIQRSSDSLKNFTTLLTLPDPSIPENGFVDNKSPGPNMYYRLFILLQNGRYFFTRSKKAIPEFTPPLLQVQAKPLPDEDSILSKVDYRPRYYAPDMGSHERPRVASPSRISEQPRVEVEKLVFVKVKDSLWGQLPGKKIREFRDSVLTKTKDTILFVHADTILIRPFVLPPKEVREVFKLSSYVYTTKDGNVTISLPDASRKKYNLRFFEQDNSPVLDIKEIRESPLILGKANFVHAGWFRFELYEDGKLKEKNRLFIPKDL